MRGQYFFTENERRYWEPIFKDKIAELCSNPDPCEEDSWDLREYDLSPANIKYLLESMGYELDSYDSNGWEQDTWYYFNIPEHNCRLIMYYCGFTFDLTLGKEL